jgi:hypothetical protein
MRTATDDDLLSTDSAPGDEVIPRVSGPACESGEVVPCVLRVAGGGGDGIDGIGETHGVIVAALSWAPRTRRWGDTWPVSASRK